MGSIQPSMSESPRPPVKTSGKRSRKVGKACCVEDGVSRTKGEEWSDPGVCGLKVCGAGGTITQKRCPVLVVPDGCTMVEGNLSQKFPQCCPTAECPSGLRASDLESSSSSSSEDDDYEDLDEDDMDLIDDEQYNAPTGGDKNHTSGNTESVNTPETLESLISNKDENGVDYTGASLLEELSKIEDQNENENHNGRNTTTIFETLKGKHLSNIGHIKSISKVREDVGHVLKSVENMSKIGESTVDVKDTTSSIEALQESTDTISIQGNSNGTNGEEGVIRNPEDQGPTKDVINSSADAQDHSVEPVSNDFQGAGSHINEFQETNTSVPPASNTFDSTEENANSLGDTLVDTSHVSNRIDDAVTSIAGAEITHSTHYETEGTTEFADQAQQGADTPEDSHMASPEYVDIAESVHTTDLNKEDFSYSNGAGNTLHYHGDTEVVDGSSHTTANYSDDPTHPETHDNTWQSTSNTIQSGEDLTQLYNNGNMGSNHYANEGMEYSMNAADGEASRVDEETESTQYMSHATVTLTPEEAGGFTDTSEDTEAMMSAGVEISGTMESAVEAQGS